MNMVLTKKPLWVKGNIRLRPTASLQLPKASRPLLDLEIAFGYAHHVRLE